MFLLIIYPTIVDYFLRFDFQHLVKLLLLYLHTRRINTVEKAKVVILLYCYIKFLVTQKAIVHYRNILKNMMNSSFSINRPGAIIPIFLLVLVQNSWRGKELNNFYPPNSSDDLCLYCYVFFVCMMSVHSNM